MLRKEEREKLQREFNQKEREKKMGVVWERIKRRRMEMKLDLELAFMEIHPPMQSFDVRVMSVLQKVVTTGSKWWDTKQRRKFEQALKSRCVLIDIKVGNKEIVGLVGLLDLFIHSKSKKKKGKRCSSHLEETVWHCIYCCLCVWAAHPDEVRIGRCELGGAESQGPGKSYSEHVLSSHSDSLPLLFSVSTERGLI